MFSFWKSKHPPRPQPRRPKPSQKQNQQLAQEVARLIGLPIISQVVARIVLGWNRAFGYDTSLTLLPLEAGVYLAAEARHLRLSDRKVSRRALVWLLTQNNHYRVGSTRLLQVQEHVTIVHGTICDGALYDAEQIAAIGRQLLRQYDEILTRLYALDFIPHGPLPARIDDREGGIHAG